MKKEPVKEKKPLWGKKQKVNAGGTDATICIAPRECDSVAIIRKAQEEIKEIKNLRVSDIVEEFFVKPFETDGGYPRYHPYYMPEFEYVLQDLIQKMQYSEIKCFEEYFARFGRKIQLYVDQARHIEELGNTIKEHKKKLGIE